MRSARGRDGRCRIDSREASVSRDKKKEESERVVLVYTRTALLQRTRNSQYPFARRTLEVALPSHQSNGSMRRSCSVTISRPVAKHDEHITLAVPEHVPQKHFAPETGSINRPGRSLVQHSAHCRYPVPLQYMHSFFSCSLKFWISITKKALRLKKKSVSPVLGDVWVCCILRCMDKQSPASVKQCVCDVFV
jgi:hypothetical protein